MSRDFRPWTEQEADRMKLEASRVLRQDEIDQEHQAQLLVAGVLQDGSLTPEPPRQAYRLPRLRHDDAYLDVSEPPRIRAWGAADVTVLPRMK